MKKVFVIDWVLVPLFAASVFTGFGLHIAGHGDSHDVWHNWAVALPYRDCGGSPVLRAHSQEGPGVEEILIRLLSSGFWGSPASLPKGTQDNVGVLKSGLHALADACTRAGADETPL